MKKELSLLMGLTIAIVTSACEKDNNNESFVTPISPEAPEPVVNPSDKQSIDLGKTLIVYYSYTNNVHNIVNELKQQIKADVIRIEPAEEGLDYAANNYAIGSALIQTIRDNPNAASSYPAIKNVDINLSDYKTIIIGTPLWWSNMAAPMQTFLYQNSDEMANKNIGLIVSSHSSGIDNVVSDAKRLLPNVTWMGDALWINANNYANRSELIKNWLPKLNFATGQNNNISKMNITIDGKTQQVTLADNAATKELVSRLQQGAITVTLNSSGGFEIWGALGFSLPTSNEQINAKPGDVVLYNGSNICMFYGSNSWSYTYLGKIEGLTESQLETFLRAGESNISVTLSL